MQTLANDLYLLDGLPRNSINVYLMGGVLVDAATRYSKRRILQQLDGKRVIGHALTHVHADHQGASHEVCASLDLPLWCGAGDVKAMESGNLEQQYPPGLFARFQNRIWAGPAHRVSRALREGDIVGGFTVIDVPGHTPGHIAFWRECDKTLLVGDVLRNMSFLSGRTWLAEPPVLFTLNPTQNRVSLRKLSALRPSLICFGHGRPLRETEKFAMLAHGLSQESPSDVDPW